MCLRVSLVCAVHIHVRLAATKALVPQPPLTQHDALTELQGLQEQRAGLLLREPATCHESEENLSET
jgi:hypothetical protein